MGREDRGTPSIAVCLAMAIDELREAVKPMGGWIAPQVKMTADGYHHHPLLEISIGFREEDLTRYISQAGQP